MKNEEFDLLKKIPMDVYDNQHPALKNYIRPYYAKCLDEIGTWLRNPGDPRRGCEVIFEHFGMMGNAGYTKDALKKIECYKREGLTDSGRFFYTMESDGNCDNIKHFQEIARRFSIKNQLVKGCFRAAFFACDGKMQSCPPKLVEFLRLSPPKLVEILQSTAMLHR